MFNEVNSLFILNLNVVLCILIIHALKKRCFNTFFDATEKPLV